jgi:hypothetical protein
MLVGESKQEAMMMILESQTEPPSCYEGRRESEQEVMMMIMESQTEPP